ncbi:phosphatase PAP2 family protein [Ruania suaedae]|uniref:phosphatase PAP2 family protein n=1 Tax=Ruania suaedae TaxID=2897774 RepID=UPI001E499838|nr:phosphatase PAP2 family protein [Ruania suaedae]UFU03411.1 phosphatase PAP2 family protein [Ruania suaedae]
MTTMTPAHPPRAVPPAPRPGRARLRGAAAPLLGAAVSAAAVIALWRIFVTTARGQQLDDVAALGAAFGRDTLEPLLTPVLTIVSVPFVALAVLAAATGAVLQRRPAIAVGAAAVLGGSNLTTQVLKELLERPDLGVTYALGNSLPSGHTTVAASVAAAALLIAPRRWRGPVAVAGVGYAALTGLATLVGGWHRPSDVVAAYLVVALWYFLVEAARQLPARAALPRGYRPAPRVNAATVLLALAAAATVLALVLGAWVASTLPPVGTEVASTSPTTTAAYAAGSLVVISTACLTTAGMLVMRPYRRD